MKPNPHPAILRLWREWIKPLLIGAVVILPLKSAVADWEWVPTGSMEPTIVPLEFVWVNKVAYDLKVPFTTRHLAEWGNPQRGDIAVFFSPADGIRLVKRVIGLPGDVIELRNELVLINGEPLHYAPWSGSTMTSDERGYRQSIFAEEDLPGRSHVVMILPRRLGVMRSFGPVQVPAGKYFMMGDNRDDSGDSRYFGFVARDQIVGQATRIVASFNMQHLALPRPSRFLQSIK